MNGLIAVVNCNMSVCLSTNWFFSCSVSLSPEARNGNQCVNHSQLKTWICLISIWAPQITRRFLLLKEVLNTHVRFQEWIDEQEEKKKMVKPKGGSHSENGEEGQKRELFSHCPWDSFHWQTRTWFHDEQGRRVELDWRTDGPLMSFEAL